MTQAPDRHVGITPALSLRGAAKTFSGRRVLDAVDLDLYPGEIHALVGQNGSGKSTLIKILSGYHAPEEGCELTLHGEPVRLPLRPGEAGRLGLAFVHQDLALVESVSVLENLFITDLRTRFPGRIDWAGERARAAGLLEQLGLDLAVGQAVASLTATERAMLAIARAVGQLGSVGSGVLVLDEPTAYLPSDGVGRLFSVMRDAARSGVAVLFVGHDLDDIMEIADRVTVLRDGRRVACRPMGELNREELTRSILGFRLEELYPDHEEVGNEVVLSLADIVGAGLDRVSLDVRRGEVLGVTGLVGSGYESVPYVVFGSRHASGRLRIEGSDFSLANWTPERAIRRGFALVPSDRVRLGAAPAATALENLTLVTLGRFTRRFGYISGRGELSRTREVMDAFDVRPRLPTAQFASFSGGNQQKLVIAKWLELEPKVLLLHEPAQGVDVGSRREILRRVRVAANAGAVTILASAEYEDLARLCDRVLVFRRGRIVSELSGSTLTHERILERCFAVPQSAAETPAA